MTINTTNQPLIIQEGRTYLTTNHNNLELTFTYPFFGPNTYKKVGSQIEEAYLTPPTMAQNASLVHAAFNSEDKYSNEIKEILKTKWLWSFTGTLYIPGKGAFVQDHPQIKNNMFYMVQSELEAKLQSNDPSVRFVPFGYKTKEMTPQEFSKNPYLIALAGQEGAEKLSEVASKFKHKPYLYGFESVDKSRTKIHPIYSGRLIDFWLVVGGYHHGGGNGCAFGVLDINKSFNMSKKN